MKLLVPAFESPNVSQVLWSTYQDAKSGFDAVKDAAEAWGGKEVKELKFKKGHRLAAFFEFKRTTARAGFDVEAFGTGLIDEALTNLRRWTAVHSFLYYRLDKPVVKDEIWDAKSRQLATFQEAHMGYGNDSYRDEFFGFDGSTGMHLPKTEEIEAKALEAIKG